MTNQTKEESQGACSDSSAEIVAWLHIQGNWHEAADRPLDDAEINLGWTQEALVRQVDYLALQEKVKEMEMKLENLNMINKGLVKACEKLEAKGAEPVGTNTFVQPVPDHCDRITWRNHYYHLPLQPFKPPLLKKVDAPLTEIGEG